MFDLFKTKILPVLFTQFSNAGLSPIVFVLFTPITNTVLAYNSPTTTVSLFGSLADLSRIYVGVSGITQTSSLYKVKTAHSIALDFAYTLGKNLDAWKYVCETLKSDWPLVATKLDGIYPNQVDVAQNRGFHRIVYTVHE